MKIAILQPYFFPYIGYWHLIKKVDKLIIYDDAQYMKSGWINTFPQETLNHLLSKSRIKIRGHRAKCGTRERYLLIFEIQNGRQPV